MSARTVGTIHRMTPEKLSEAALEAMGRKHAYSVGIDWTGKVYVDLPQNIAAADIIMTCLRSTDPYTLAEEIRDEVNRRAKALASRKKS